MQREAGVVVPAGVKKFREFEVRYRELVNPDASRGEVREQWQLYQRGGDVAPPARASPARRSPRRSRSPERYGLESLQGQPLELQQRQASALDLPEIRALRIAGRFGAAMTQRRLEQLCEELPKAREVLRYLDTNPTHFSVILERDHAPYYVYLTTRKLHGRTYVSYTDASVSSYEHEEEPSLVLLTFKSANQMRELRQKIAALGGPVLVDPNSLYRILKARGSCNTGQGRERFAAERTQRYVTDLARDGSEPYVLQGDPEDPHVLIDASPVLEGDLVLSTDPGFSWEQLAFLALFTIWADAGSINTVNREFLDVRAGRKSIEAVARSYVNRLKRAYGSLGGRE